MNRKKILVSAFTHLNLGDDLFLKILFGRYPDADFVLIGEKEKYINIFKSKNVSYLQFPKTIIDNPYIRKIAMKFFFRLYVEFKYWINKNFLIKKQSQFDAVISIGGSIFIQPRSKFLYKKNFHFVFADVFENKPKFILGANFGPYTDESFLDNYKDLLKKYTDVCFRDWYSKSLFSDLENVRQSPDIVFSLKTVITPLRNKTVGFSLIDIAGRDYLKQYTEAYENYILKLIRHFGEKNYTLYLFSFCKAEGDEKMINKLYAKIPSDYRSKVEKVFYNGDISSFLSVFNNMEVMFATRFHAMILSLITNQKTIPIIYSNKMKHVLKDINFTGHFIEIDKVNPIEDIYSEELITIHNLSESITKQAEDHFIKLDNFLLYK